MVRVCGGASPIYGAFSGLPNTRVFLSLRKLGYIVWRPDNPYLAEHCDDADLVVFKPNSRFQKKQPSGLLFPLKLVPVSSPVAQLLSSVTEKNTAYALYDETGQVYITLADITDKFNA
jgi:hypothetical protein